MNDSREHDGWLDPALAEQLLRGDYADATRTDARAAALARLLTAAAEPRPVPRHHERAALAAFREIWGEPQEGAAPGSAGLGHAPDGRGKGAARAPLRRTAAGRRRPWAHRARCRPARAVIGGVAAVFALGGVAIAAQTGTLPHPFHHPPGAASSQQASPGSPGSPAARTPGPPPTAAVPPAGNLSPTHPGASGSYPLSSGSAADATKLCKAYAKSLAKGRPLGSPTRTRLEQAAGGKDQVGPFCTRLTTTHTTPVARPQPSAPVLPPPPVVAAPPIPSATPSPSLTPSDPSPSAASSSPPAPELSSPPESSTARSAPPTTPGAATTRRR